MKRIFPIMIMLFAFSDCTRTLSSQESDSIKMEVEQLLSSIADSIHAGGLAGWLSFMHQSPDFFWEFHGIRNSYDSLVAGEQRESPRYLAIALAWDSIHVRPIAPDKAAFFASYVEVVVDTARQHTTLEGSVEANVIKISGSWKILNGRTFKENRGSRAE